MADETSGSNVTATTTANTNNEVLRIIEKRIRALRKHNRILETEESLSQGKSLNNDQLELLSSKRSILDQTNFLEKLFKDILNPKSLNVNASTADAAIKAVKNREKEDIKPVEPMDKERYLCISDGFTLYCLDLKQSKDHSNSDDSIQPLPIKYALKLPENGLPVLLSLFKLGSDAYITGGKKFSAFDKDPHHWFMDIFSSFANNPGLNSTSHNTYRVSIADGYLSVSECDNIKPLNGTFASPIVEKIGDQIHMIEFVPASSSKIRYNDVGRKANHEFLNLNDLSGGWNRIRQITFDYMSYTHVAKLYAHIVVGDRIYVQARCPCKRILILDSETKQWEKHGVLGKCSDAFIINHVVQISKFGTGKCVGVFMRGEFCDSLYVVFAIVVDERSVHAVAYLVAITGDILCLQRVPQFFERSARPTSVIKSSTVINVDEEGESFCSIIDGKMDDNKLESECLFINTFTVEELPGAGSWIPDVWGRRIDERWAVERDFVRVVVKDRYVYKTYGLYSGQDLAPARIQACFLYTRCRTPRINPIYKR